MENCSYCSRFKKHCRPRVDSLDIANKYCISQNWNIPLILLNSSIAKSWMFLWWNVTDPSFSNSSSKLMFSSGKTSLRQRSCKWLILFSKRRVWNIQTSGQYLNWVLKKAFISFCLLAWFIKGALLERALTFWLAILHRWSM